MKEGKEEEEEEEEEEFLWVQCMRVTAIAPRNNTTMCIN